MRTRTSHRNQARVHKMLSAIRPDTGESVAAPPRPAPPPMTDAEIDAMWWAPKQSRRMMKLDAAKKRKAENRP